MAGNGRPPKPKGGETERTAELRPPEAPRSAGPPIPGVIIVWSGDGPTLRALRLPSLGLILGRELLGPKTTDDRISRQHARVRWNGTAFAITDLGSRNGTYVGGSLVSENEVTVTAPCVLRTGRTVSVLVGDVRPYEDGEVVQSPDGVVGPRRAAVHDVLRKMAADSDAVMIVSETGAGVDAAVTIYHSASGGGELVEIEASKLDATSSKRWWAGAGMVPPEACSAHGGTLVIHELSALDADGQAALSAILGTGELHKHEVDARVIAVCDPEEVEPLRLAVQAGTFRDDLWRRLSPHRLDIPPLRQCSEELPHWVVSRVRDIVPELSVHSTLIEACLLRPWPGNIDELRHEIAAAAILARDGGKRSVRGDHLDGDAGMLIALGGPATLAPSLTETARLRRARAKNPLEEDHVRAALVEQGGDLARTAIALGVHRNRLRRFLADNPDLAPLVSDDDQHRTAVLTEEE